MYRWWIDLKSQVENITKKNSYSTKDIKVEYEGSLIVGEGTFISKDAKLNGNIVIGNNCMIGTNVVIRGNVKIHDNVKIGYAAEIKNSVIKENSTIGPMCYIGDSLVESNVYLGALVRTSNHRLDKMNIKSWNGEYFEDTGMEKLGAWIKCNTSIGIASIILPGRIVPENSIFSPSIIINKNYPSGIYKIEQNIIKF
ncbi:UNVERIFIED_CONTAM: bifunctional UDP-N-acetylglucosamine pyrophosphorylase/glucosamine-1-phosphate N-acetyltransferase [Acetivibrio alkalicellulosi]